MFLSLFNFKLYLHAFNYAKNIKFVDFLLIVHVEHCSDRVETYQHEKHVFCQGALALYKYNTRAKNTKKQLTW